MHEPLRQGAGDTGLPDTFDSPLFPAGGSARTLREGSLVELPKRKPTGDFGVTESHTTGERDRSARQLTPTTSIHTWIN
jgi:hypothetical protein